MPSRNNAELVPTAQVVLTSIPLADGYQVSPPIVYAALASQMQAESGSDVDGRYVEPTGEIEGAARLLPQDTYISGTGSRTGLAFNSVSGTWKDDWVSPKTNKYGLLMPDATNAVVFEVLQTTAYTAGMRHWEVVIRRGQAPNGSTPAADTVYCYLEFNYGSGGGAYRLAMEWGTPIRLDFKEPGSAVWRPVAVSRKLGDTETYLRQNNDEIRFRIRPDRKRGQLRVELGSGEWLSHAYAPDTQGNRTLPGTERFRLTGKNGWASLEMYPLRFGSARVRKSKRSYSQVIPNVQDGAVFANGTGKPEDTQTVTGSATQENDFGLRFDATATLPDAGEGIGSSDPPTLSDVTVVIPAQWVTAAYGFVPTVTGTPKQVLEDILFDEITGIVTRSCRITWGNRWSEWSSQYGNLAFNLTGANGLTWGQRMRGIIASEAGTEVIRRDPIRLAVTDGHDFFYKLREPIGQEIILDGWCIFSAFHFVLELGQIHPAFRLRIPFYRYGQADASCPYPILGRGTGFTPKWRFSPETPCMTVLLALLEDAGAVNSFGVNVPLVLANLRDGSFDLVPYDPRFLPVRKFFSDMPGSGITPIQDIRAYTSVDHMRTDLIFQGQDPFSYELLHTHFPMAWNVGAVGYRRAWVERNNRWASEEYLLSLLRSAAIKSSLPTQVLQIKAAFDPNLDAGDLVWVSESQAIRRTGLFVVTHIRNAYGQDSPESASPFTMCDSIITCRSAETLVPF